MSSAQNPGWQAPNFANIGAAMAGGVAGGLGGTNPYQQQQQAALLAQAQAQAQQKAAHQAGAHQTAAAPITVPGLNVTVPQQQPITVPGLNVTVPQQQAMTVPGLNMTVPQQQQAAAQPITVPGLKMQVPAQQQQAMQGLQQALTPDQPQQDLTWHQVAANLDALHQKNQQKKAMEGLQLAMSDERVKRHVNRSRIDWQMREFLDSLTPSAPEAPQPRRQPAAQSLAARALRRHG